MQIWVKLMWKMRFFTMATQKVVNITVTFTKENYAEKVSKFMVKSETEQIDPDYYKQWNAEIV